MMIASPRARRKARSGAARPARARRRGLARLRNAYFARAWEFAARYGVKFDQVVAHLWRARRKHAGLRLRCVACVEDLVQAIACAEGVSVAWSDLCQQHERTLARRCRDCRDELEATVLVRRFLAQLRREALERRSALRDYSGTRPLRAWLCDALQQSRQHARRSAFVLDPGDSTCGAPFQFSPTSAG
jgi:hypothetical protein